MTEAQWLASTEPMPMLEHLRSKITKTAAGRRKLRLLACACVRRFWEVMIDGWDRNAVLVAERYADGQANKTELLKAREAARNLRGRKGKPPPGVKIPQLTWPAQLVAVPGAWEAATWTLRDCPTTAWFIARDSGPYDTEKSASSTGERREHARLVRDIFGNPFRPVTVGPNWLTSTVVALAQQMYQSRDFGAMPILADALQDAGCDNTDILNHCRAEGPHVRGCWALDLVLGKE